MKLCPNLTFLYTECKTYAERYASAKAFGFQGVEICFPYDENLEELKKGACLKTILINSYPGGAGEFGFAALPDKEVQFKESFAKSMDYARELGVSRLHIMSGIPSAEDSRTSCYETLKKNLLHVLPELEESNIVGVVEPINAKTIPGYFLNNYEEALNLVKAIDSPYLKLQLDIFHLQQIQGNITSFLEKALPYAGHIQIAQVPFRNEPDSMGEVNYKYVFDLISKASYDGWIGLEYKPQKDTVTGFKWIEKYGLKV